MIIKKWLAFFRGDKPIDWAKLNTNEERMRAIAMAADGELGEMWAAWEKRGMSREGVTYAKVLERRAGWVLAWCYCPRSVLADLAQLHRSGLVSRCCQVSAQSARVRSW